MNSESPGGADRHSGGGSTRLRLARPGDLRAIADIYNHEVLHATSTFDTEPVTVAERGRWLADHEPARHPVIVAAEDPGAAVVAFASLSAWSRRRAYARTAEVSVYVHRRARGRGLGRALLADLIDRARAAGHAVLLARICSEGQASLRLHESLGFVPVGTMHRVGEKFGRVLDVELCELLLER